MDALLRPIPLVFNSYALTQHQSPQHHNCLVVAGSDINVDAQVYLLYEMPTSMLAKRFNYDLNDGYLKIMVILTYMQSVNGQAGYKLVL